MTRLGALVHYPTAALLALAVVGCARNPAPSREIRFWAMGREGEVVQQLLPEFERRHPACACGPADPVERRAREAADGVRRRARCPMSSSSAARWIPEFVAHRRARAARRAPLGRSPSRATTSRASSTPTASTARSTACRGTSIRALLFYRTDLLAAAGLRRRAGRLGRAGLARWPAVKQRAGRGNYAMLLPVSEWQPPVILALQRGATLLRDGDRYGDFQSAAFRTAFAFYLRHLPPRLRPGRRPRGRSPTSIRTLPPVSSPSTSAVRGTSASSATRLPPAMRERWTTAPMPAPEAGHARRLDRRRRQSGAEPRCARQRMPPGSSSSISPSRRRRSSSTG